MTTTIGCSRFGSRSVFQERKDRKIGNRGKERNKVKPIQQKQTQNPPEKSDYL